MFAQPYPFWYGWAKIFWAYLKLRLLGPTKISLGEGSMWGHGAAIGVSAIGIIPLFIDSNRGWKTDSIKWKPSDLSRLFLDIILGWSNFDMYTILFQTIVKA